MPKLERPQQASAPTVYLCFSHMIVNAVANMAEKAIVSAMLMWTKASIIHFGMSRYPGNRTCAGVQDARMTST
jgi:uncharacterized membrane protein